MRLEDILYVDCRKAKELLSIGKIIAINARVTSPESFEEMIQHERDLDENLDLLVKNAEKESEEYTDGHSEDSFGFQQLENVENLIETEFKYICEENNDLIYLSAFLMHRIASGHPFEEGNKRTSYLAASYFLIDYISFETSLEAAAFPELDSDLLDALEDIAMDSDKVSPEELSAIYRDSVKNELKEIIESESS